MIKTEFRTIVTEVPHPEALKMADRLAAVESHSMHGQLPVVWDRAEGSSVYDPWGTAGSTSPARYSLPTQVMRIRSSSMRL